MSPDLALRYGLRHGDKVSLASPVNELHRGSARLGAELTIRNGAEGRVVGVRPDGMVTVAWTLLGVDVPVPAHWLRKGWT